MSDAQINPDDPQGQFPRGEEWIGGARVPDPGRAGSGIDAFEGTGEPDSSWLLEDDSFDPVVSSEPAETESVQALPAELDALQEQVVAPTWSEEEALLGDDPMIGASYVEPPTASSAVTRALVPAAICMALSFGAIAVWSFFEEGAQNVPDDVAADLQVEGPARPYSEPDVELVVPEVGNPVETGRLSYQRDGAIVPADSYGPSVARSTVDSPREPGELPPAPAVTDEAGATVALHDRSTEPVADAAEATAALDPADAFTPTAGSIAEEADTTVAADVVAASTPEITAPSADARGGEGTEVAALMQVDVAAIAEDAPSGANLADERDAPGTGGLPDSYVLEMEPLDEEALRRLEALETSSDDRAPVEMAIVDEQELAPAGPTRAVSSETIEVVRVAPTPVPEEVRVAPLPGDEALGAFALRFPGPDFGPASPGAPEVLTGAPSITQPGEEPGPAAAFLPFGLFGEDGVASLGVEPEFVAAEFEVSGPQPVDVSTDGADELGEHAMTESDATASECGDPWIPLEVVMGSFASGGSSDEVELDALAEDDEAYPAAVTVEIEVSGDDDVAIAVEDLDGPTTGTTGESVAAADLETCAGEAVAHERLDAIFGPALRESEPGEPLMSEVFPAPGAADAERNAGDTRDAAAFDPAARSDGDAELAGAVATPERSALQKAGARTTLALAGTGGAAANDVERPTVEAPAVRAGETAGEAAASAQVEVEVLPGFAASTASPKFRGVVRRISTGNIWPHCTVPEDEVGKDAFVLTPSVGEVRVVFDEGETIDGRLHGVGQNRIVLDTRLGRLTLDGRRANRIDRFGRKSTRPSTGRVNTKGLDLVRVKADGGIFQGHLLSRENGKVTLLLEQGMRITLESDDVEPAVGDKSVSRIRRDR
ncbi:MAG: hypothetical protein VX460_14315 [Planctomycetota bacterium]|nr:hypothetical protein [Planctomycetota bacterium]